MIGTIVTQGWRELGWMAFVTVFVFIIWMYLIQLLIALLLGLKSFVSLRDFLLAVTTTQTVGSSWSSGKERRITRWEHERVPEAVRGA